MALHTAYPWFAALAAAALLLPACSDAEPAGPVDGTYIARVGETMIAIVASSTDALTSAYACDGRDGADATVAAWFHADRAEATAELVGTFGALTVTFDGDTASGELRLDGGAAVSYEAALAQTGELRWAHDETGDRLLGGWIFADDGTQRGAVIKRNTGDVASFSLVSQTTTSASFDGVTLMVKQMVTPTIVE